MSAACGRGSSLQGCGEPWVYDTGIYWGVDKLCVAQGFCMQECWAWKGLYMSLPFVLYGLQ